MTQFNPIKSQRMRMVSASVSVGGNSYDPTSDATRPNLVFPCKDIVSIDDVTVWCTGGYFARVSAKTGVATVAVRCYDTTNVADVKDHAQHLHTITTTGVGGGDAVSIKNLALEDAGGGHVGVTGIQNAAAMAHAQASAAGGGVELSKNNSAFTVYGTAIGFV